MAYDEYTGGDYGGTYGGSGGSGGGQNYGRGYGGNYRGNYRGYGGAGNYAPQQQGNYGQQQQQQANYSPSGQSNYGPVSQGNYGNYGGLSQLAMRARGTYGAPGAYGRGGFGGGGYQTGGGYGLGPASGTATGYGPPPQRIGSTYDAPALQSQRQLNAPGAISAGANYSQPDPQASAPGGELSGQPPSMMDRLASVLGGIQLVGDVSAAEATPSMLQSGSQNTLTPEDVQAAPFKGPFTGTDTGQGRQLGAPYSGRDPTSAQTFEGTWAGNDPTAGGEAAPMGGAIPPAAPATSFDNRSGTGWFTADQQAGGEAAPMGGAQPPPPDAGWFSTAGNTLGGEAAPMGGAPAPTSNETVPETGATFADKFNAAPTDPLWSDFGKPPPGTPADRVSAEDRLAFSGQTAETPGDAALRDRLSGLTGSYAAPTDWGPSPDQAKGDQLLRSSSADQSTQLAMQGVDATPPGGSLTGGGPVGFDPGAFSGGGPPSAFAGASPVPGTTADTATPPVPGSPADPTFAQRFADAPTGQAVSPLQAFIGTPIGQQSPVGTDFSPSFLGGNPPGPFQQGATLFGDTPDAFTAPAVSPPPRFATNIGTITPSTGGAPAAVTGGEPAPTPRASSTGVAIGPASYAGVPTVPSMPQDARGQGVGRETDPQYNQPPPNSVAGAISNLFGGGDMGNTIAKLMLQLGIPAALIFAATRGSRGGGMGLVGGQNAMSGAGRIGGFQPNFSRNLFPGPGLPALAGLGITGALVGNKLANPQPAQQPSQDHPDVTNRGPAAPATPARDAPDSFTVPSGPTSIMPLPVPHRTPLQIAQSGAQNGVVGWLQQRGGHSAGQGAPDLNPEFASRVQRAAMAYEAETGRPARFGEMGRSQELQSKYYADFRRTGQGLAAPPGQSRHEKGMAIDIPDGDFQNWMHRNASRFGLAGLRDPRDPNHFQMAAA